MTISAQLIAIPAAIITIASYVAYRDDKTFRDSDRFSEVQSQKKRVASRRPGKTAGDVDGSIRLNHDRYGWNSDEAASQLGNDIELRPLGGRSSPGADWLASKRTTGLSQAVMPDIAGFEEPVAPTDPLAQSISAEAGYHITADEVSKLDANTGRVIFNSNVRLTSPRFHLTANQLVVHLGKDKSTMQLVEAHGTVNVLLTGVPEEKVCRGQSNDATFDPKRETIVLTGWPKVKTRDQEQVAAESSTKMTLFTKSGRMVTEGRAQTRIAKSFMDESTGTTTKTPR